VTAACEDLFDGPAFDQRDEIREAGVALFGLFVSLRRRGGGARTRFVKLANKRE
jgi:hypothetical protein